MDEAVLARGADGLLVERLGVEVPALDARELGPDQRGAAAEVLGAVRRPDLELLAARDRSSGAGR
ncbi:hypothetical protein SCE1572_25440 [Sorangium cellulosum So0157-2]|uniref:Uncharacterized protein n=1 Tax=Sorangium cellulosum So0157-2 TaxID=1254432 RepID=S4XWG6_SORCE|nr:hypothetical protein SCE1572_25440 [Sorangium cellulosum So0157-2]